MVLAIFFGGIAWTSLGYTMEISVDDLGKALFWNHAGYPTAMLLPPLMLLLAQIATGRVKQLRAGCRRRAVRTRRPRPPRSHPYSRPANRTDV